MNCFIPLFSLNTMCFYSGLVLINLESLEIIMGTRPLSHIFDHGEFNPDNRDTMMEIIKISQVIHVWVE